MSQNPLLIGFAFTFLCFCIQSCSSPPKELTLHSYFPDPSFHGGEIYNKYYNTINPGNNRRIVTILEYDKYTRDKNQMTIKKLSPSLVLTQRNDFELSDKVLKVVNHSNFDLYNTKTQYKIADSISLDISGEPFKISLLFDSTGNYVKTGLVTKDTVWENKKAIIVESKEIFLNENDTTLVRSSRSIYAEGLGKVFSVRKNDGTSITTTLIQQYSKAEIDELRKSVPKRVAYIDPENTIIPTPEFTTCNDTDRIMDYYNRTPRAQYIGGRYSLRKNLLPKIDFSLLEGESGYLTIRFVINCKGEVGRFTVDQADLNYNPKSFPEASVKQIATAISQLTSWQPISTEIHPENKHGIAKADAYAYITIKLKDGKFIEFLP